MTFEALNNNVMLVELSGDEMKSFNITYATLNNNETTQALLKKLLYRIDAEKRFSKGDKVLVEAMPTENGGCFFIFTFTSKEKIRYKIKSNKDFTVFKADNIDDFLDFIKVAGFYYEKNISCRAFKLNNNYFLIFPEKNDRICQLMTEYGEKSENISYEWLNEYCKNLGKVYLQ